MPFISLKLRAEEAWLQGMSRVLNVSRTHAAADANSKFIGRASSLYLSGLLAWLLGAEMAQIWRREL